MAKSLLKQASVRDFTGGLNLTDNPYNLSSKYQMVSDNCIVGPDGSLSPRMGYKYLCNLRNPSTPTVTIPTVTLSQVNFFSSSTQVLITWFSHGFSSADTIQFVDSTIVNGYQLQGIYTIDYVNINAFNIHMTTVATAAASSVNVVVNNIIRSRYLGPGNTLEMAFFQGNLVIFDDTGAINAVNPDLGLIVRIWDNNKAADTLGAPAGWYAGASHVSYATFKQTLLAVDGRTRDKPIEINFQRPGAVAPVQYLGDPGASYSNANVYAADLILSFGGYVMLFASSTTHASSSTGTTLTTVDFSAKDTSSVFVGATTPLDAMNMDLGIMSLTVEPRFTAASYIRNKVFVAFPDSAMLGTIGINPTPTTHEPDFNDQVPQHGALNHRVVQNIGNDLFMCDSAGVPAYSQSLQSSVIAPERLSQLIYSELNKHLARLSQYTLRYKIWSVYSVRDRMYMLFMPKFDEASVRTTTGEVIFVVSDFRLDQQVIFRVPNHGVSAGDYITIAGSISCEGLPNAYITGTRRVVAVIDSNNILIMVGAIPSVDGAIGTAVGTVTSTPIDDESICYAYQYNPMMKIRRWTRLRGWYFVAGCTSNDGRVFVCDKSNRIWQLGTIDRPIYADQVGYTTDDVENPLSGIAINWAAETPWSDFGDRTLMKVGEHATFDVEGFGRFDFSLFVDNIYDDKATYQLSPAAGIAVSTIPNVYGEDVNAFGAGAMTYGAGRRSREQHNYHFPFRCKLARMRFQGASKEYLRIVAVTLSYKIGSAYR